MSTVDAGIPYRLWVVQLGIWSGKLLRFGSPPHLMFQRFPEFYVCFRVDIRWICFLWMYFWGNLVIYKWCHDNFMLIFSVTRKDVALWTFEGLSHPILPYENSKAWSVWCILPICLSKGYMLGYQKMTIFLGPVVPQVAERASSHRSGTRRMLRRICGRSKWKEAKKEKALGILLKRMWSGINQG